MSRAKSQTKESLAFIARFAEACGSSKPAEVKRLLNISYQTAKNYLNGRLPHPEVLITIAQRTSYSIDWLLTGRGKKIVDDSQFFDTPLPTGQMEAFVRRICVEVINEKIGKQAVYQRTVKLQSSELMSEKVVDESNALTGRQP